MKSERSPTPLHLLSPRTPLGLYSDSARTPLGLCHSEFANNIFLQYKSNLGSLPWNHLYSRQVNSIFGINIIHLYTDSYAFQATVDVQIRNLYLTTISIQIESTQHQL